MLTSLWGLYLWYAFRVTCCAGLLVDTNYDILWTAWLVLIVLCQFSKKLVLGTLSLRWCPFTAFIGIEPRRKSASLTFLLHQNDLKRVKAVVGSCGHVGMLKHGKPPCLLHVLLQSLGPIPGEDFLDVHDQLQQRIYCRGGSIWKSEKCKEPEKQLSKITCLYIVADDKVYNHKCITNYQRLNLLDLSANPHLETCCAQRALPTLAA